MNKKRVIFFILLYLLLLLPIFFYYSKYTKNPEEFKSVPKQYLLIGVRVKDASPELESMVKLGDKARDVNGENNAEIFTIVKTESDLYGKDLYLDLKARYVKIGSTIFLHPTYIELLVGRRFDLAFPDYYINADIVRVGPFIDDKSS